MQCELVSADALLHPLIGHGGLTHEEAHAEIQAILDRVKLPAVTATAAMWRRGAEDDTVYVGTATGMLIWTIYEHPEGEDPRVGALAWLEDFAEIMRGTGMDVLVASLP